MICSLCMRRIWFGQRTVSLGGQATAHVACEQRHRDLSAQNWAALKASRDAYERMRAQPSEFNPIVQGLLSNESFPEAYRPSSDDATSRDASGYSGGGGDFGGGGASGDYGSGNSSGGND